MTTGPFRLPRSPKACELLRDAICESKNSRLIGVAFANAAGNKLPAETSRSGATNEDTTPKTMVPPSAYDLESGLEERRIHVFPHARTL